MAVSQALYTPILKWKRGEQLGVEPLSNAQKSLLLPIAELADRPYDWEEGEYTKSWDRHIEDVAKATSKYWGTVHEIAFDQMITEDDSLESHPGTPWAFLFHRMWSWGVQAVPVVSTLASPSERAALKKCADEHGRSRWLLRYVWPAGDAQGGTPGATAVAAWLAACLGELQAAAQDVDVLLDVGHVGGIDPAAIAAPVATLAQHVAAMAAWRSLILASGAFPANLAGIPKGTFQIPRRDWTLYRQVRAMSTCPPGLRYGDYGISHVDAFDEDPRMLKMSANLRYTQFVEWHVLKGASVRDKGFDQYIDFCKLLCGLPIFMGSGFSHGDQHYDNIATGVVAKPGNATQWRRDATNHHLHVVLSQLTGASSGGPSGTP